MRLTLLLICLFSILGGCAASSCHGVTVPKLVSFSGKQSSSLSGKHNLSIKPMLFNDELTSVCILRDDIEDDDDKTGQSFKINRVLLSTLIAYVHAFVWDKAPHHYLSSSPAPGVSARKYIAQRVLRV
jgi:hypothetical protein